MSSSENISNSPDYQKTLNLPKTDFAMKANLVQREPQFLAQWTTDKIYEHLRAKSKGKKPFILHDGPPYANGHIHIGHALNKILKDIIVRYKTMKGFDALYVPGWDCHGLPIEHQLLKDLKARKGDFDTVVFRKKAHDYAMKFVGIQKEEFKRLGIWAEWDTPYLTLAPSYEHWILKSLAVLKKKGYVYRSLKPVNWCFNCETALAEAEVEHEDHSSQTAYVRFQVKNPEVLGIPAASKLSLLIWTTTPWTLLANVAVTIHAEFDYVLAQSQDEILVVEKTLAEKVFALAGHSYKVIKEVKGADLKKLVYAHPFGKLESCPVVSADYVTKEDGTGLVHTAPGHGQEDFQTGLANKLPVLMPVNSRGVFTEEGAPFTGQHVFKAMDAVLADLTSRGLLFASVAISHTYPHCWRCKNPIIFRATEQWFMSIDHNNLRQQLRDAIERDVEFVPPAGRERILGMVNTRPDWCLSRQRLWGVPIPAVVCKGCKDEHKLFVEVIEHLAELVKTHGSDIWFEKEIKDLLPTGFKCPDCGGTAFEKTHDILDVWFDSGVSHQAVFRTLLNSPLPADLYLEGSDQHRGWFQSSLIPSVAIDGKAPYRQVLTHGFVVDGQGRKMSKSLGNVVSPQEIISQNGADILRLWVASSSYNDDVRISKEIIDRLVDSYRKIRNTVRYLLGNLSGFNPDTDVLEYSKLLDLDRWALNRLAALIKTVDEGYEAYDFVMVYKAIHSFCNEDLSSIYLDILKDRLYTCPASSAERRSAQTVLYHILDTLTRMVAPMMVVTSEEIFAISPKTTELSKVPSVHVLAWPTVPAVWVSPQVQDSFKDLLEFRSFVLKALDEQRKQGAIGSGLEAKVIIKTASDRDYNYLKSFGSYLASYCIVSQISLEKVISVSGGLSEYFAQTTIEVKAADGQKCGRCWNYRTDVGAQVKHPSLCVRCAQVVDNLT
ncbi:MAG: isoleucine--tRNA ligase [Candidatus Omnitrophica bacterium]|nr:isoleucine--tRNA ligase [Candidatus Omnitrophota bacterium]